VEVTTIFGNSGSNELPFLKDFPAGFSYFHALHEGVAIGMADGCAKSSILWRLSVSQRQFWVPRGMVIVLHCHFCSSAVRQRDLSTFISTIVAW
jgi:hypothetical protein